MTNEPKVEIKKRRLAWLRPSHQHTAFSATLLLMVSVTLSRVIGLVREKYIAYIFGAGGQTDTYRAAFQLPDTVNYFLVGGVGSIVFISMLGRYREQGREEEGEKALASILSMMLVVLSIGVLIAEIFARFYVAWCFKGFSPEKIAQTTLMTRILLPGPLFFFVGGVLASVLIVRKQFIYQAVSPLLYNIGIILGGILLASRIGVPSLAVGAVVGIFCGQVLLNYFGLHRAGVRLRLTRNWRHPGLREWFRQTLPLMLSFSLVTVDIWIINYLASNVDGEIARLNFAKALFTAPMAVLGQAAGAASMPFFAALVAQGRMKEFAAQVNSSVTRIMAISLLASAALIGLAHPLADLLRGGALHQQDANRIALYLAIFSVSLFLWSSQTIYARAFYAAGNTLTPAIASSIVTLFSIPIYAALYRTHGAVGLAIASDIGILIQTVTTAVLLQRSNLVQTSGLDWIELGRSLLAACVGGAALFGLMRVLPAQTGFAGDLLQLAVGGAVWLACCWLVLHFSGSKLPQLLTQRFFKRGKSAPQAA